MVTYTSKSPEETFALGRECASKAREGMVIALSGDLGAGKTQWVKGFASGLGITERVHSPTFALINEYPGGRCMLYHLDLYRLESVQQILAAGLEEFLEPRGISVIEWAEHWFQPGQAPEGILWVRIETVNETERKLHYEGPGY